MLLFLALLGLEAHRQGNLPAAFQALHTNSTSPDFADTRTVTYSIDCLLSGQDPYVVRSFDPWHRLYNYPPIWLDLRYLGVSSRTTELMAITMAVLFSLSLLALFKPQTKAAAVCTILGVISRPTLFAIERGNIDLIMFVLMVFGFLFIERWRSTGRTISQGVLVILLVVLKIFPIAGVVVFLRNRKGVWTAIGVAALSLIALVLTSGSKLPMVLANTPQDTFYSYGSYPLLAAFNAHLPHAVKLTEGALHAMSPVMALILATLAIVVGMVYRGHLERLLPPLDFDRAEGCIAVSGLAIYCFTFLRGSSYEYRLIFLLGVLAYLVNDLRKGQTRSLWAAMILTLFYAARWTNRGIPIEMMDGLIYCGACAWLGTTLLARLMENPEPISDTAVAAIAR